MRLNIFSALLFFACSATMQALSEPLPDEDGSRLWLRANVNQNSKIDENIGDDSIKIAKKELNRQWKGSPVKLLISHQKELQNDAFRISFSKNFTSIESATSVGILYGTYHLLRLQELGELCGKKTIKSAPSFDIRMLNHWDNLDGSVERGYAGKSIWKWEELPEKISPRYEEYARANASIGINAIVLNNVNANPKILDGEYLTKVKVIADIFRPYGIKVYLSVNFASPQILGKLNTSDPENNGVKIWWKKKFDEIYKLIPDFGGVLVKANSEGQPGPQDFGRTHADGANMLAEILKPHNGIVFWRAFVYAPDTQDRAIQAYNEFMPLDGKFADNVILQIKNGPIDFQPREPFNPLFGALKKTSMCVEFQLTQEYLGFSNHLVYLSPLIKECLNYDTFVCGQNSTIAKTTNGSLRKNSPTAVCAVANIGEDKNWTGHHFAQANWYAFGRLSWNCNLSSDEIAEEWLKLTFSNNPVFLKKAKRIMMISRETAVNYMMPLGLHHIFAEGHHYGPQPWHDKAERIDWTSTYYHKASKYGIGFDRTSNGTGAVNQYNSPLKELYENPDLCPDEYLLFFHHLPWKYTMKNGDTLWNNLCKAYDCGVKNARMFQDIWNSLRPYIDKRRFEEVKAKFEIQANDAVWWRDACLLYFQTFSGLEFPEEIERPTQNLEDLKNIKLNLKHHN